MTAASGAIENYVNVAITIASPTVTQAGFGVAMCAGSSTGFSGSGDLIRYYTSLTGVKADFLTSDPEYKAATAAFSQSPCPPKIAIGYLPASVKGVMTITFGGPLIASNSFIATVNGVTLTATVYATSNAATLTAIATKIAALATVYSAISNGTDTITVTSNVGTSPTITAAAVTLGASQVSTTIATSTPAVLLSTGLAAIKAVDNGWYGLSVVSRAAGDLIDVGDWAEANLVRFLGQTSDAGVITTSTTDVASLAVGKSYGMTTIVYHSPDTEHLAFGILAQQLSNTPGSATWMFKTVPGVAVDPLTASQYTNALGKNVMVYTAQSGVNMTEQGKTAGGQFIDVMFGRDWLQSTLKTDIFGLLTVSPKVPYTDKGAAQIESVIRARLAIGVRNGFLADDGSVFVKTPKVADQATADRAARLMPGITFGGNLAGAVHKVTLTGTLAV